MTRKVASEATPAAVDSGIQAASSEKNQRQVVDAIDPEMVEEATEKTVSGSMDGALAALSDEERQAELAAFMRPIVASMVDTSVDSALTEGNLTKVRELAKQATLGFQDAIDEVEHQKENGKMAADEGNVLKAADDVAEGGDIVLYALGALAVVLALLLLVGTWWALRKKRLYEADNARHYRDIESIVEMWGRAQKGDNKSSAGAPSQPLSDDEELLQQVMRHLAKRRSANGGPQVPKQ